LSGSQLTGILFIITLEDCVYLLNCLSHPYLKSTKFGYVIWSDLQWTVEFLNLKYEYLIYLLHFDEFQID